MTGINKAVVLVPSILINLERLISDFEPRAWFLGCRWSFAARTPVALAEYELSEPWPEFAARLSRFSGIQLEFHCFDEEDAIVRAKLGQSIVVAVDSFELPYRPAYRRVHSARTVVIEAIDEDAGMAMISDVWMPAYRGPVTLDALDRARRSSVPRDDDREPLFAGKPLNAKWWAVSPVEPRMASATAEAALLEAATEAHTTDSASAMEEFCKDALQSLSSPLPQSFEARRAAALLLRAEIGLRAYLLRLLDASAGALRDTLFAAELQCW